MANENENTYNLRQSSTTVDYSYQREGGKGGFDPNYNTNITVNQTTYSVMDEWLKIMSKYFNLDLDRIRKHGETLNDSEISLLKAGLFGYINETMSAEVKNAVAHRNTLYEEYFINSASFPESIYKFAKAYNVDISTAKPAHMIATMAIRKTDIINSPLKKEVVEDQYIKNSTLKTYRIRLDRHNEFNVGKFKFMVPYDIIITIKQISPKEYAITANYDYNDNLYRLSDYTNKEIKVYQDIVNGENYVYLSLDLYQVRSNTNVFNIANTDDIDGMFYTIDHQDQIAGFNVKYTVRDKTYYIKPYFNNTFTPENREEKFCYYTFVDDNKLQISFSNMIGTFKPELGSTLEIEVLSTKGEEGNFNFIDRIEYSINNTDVTNFYVMLTDVRAETSSAGGRNKLTLSEEKSKIINKMTTRDNLIMNKDLEHYFQNVNTQSTYNGSQITFMKKRDDMLLRIYNAFLLMRDNEGNLLPTTTAPRVDFPVQWFTDNNTSNLGEGYYVIPEHTIFRYNTTNKKYEVVENGYDDNLQNEISNDKDNMIYVNPFLIRIDTNPILNAYYYKLDINETFAMNYTYKNSNIITNLLVNQMSIEKSTDFKEDLNSDTYTVKLNLNTNEAIQDVDKKIKIRGVLLSKRTGKKYGYFEFNRESSEKENIKGNESSVYKAHLSTNRSFQKGNLALTHSLYNVDGEMQKEVFIEEDCIIKIGILYYDADEKYRGNDSLNAENSIFADAFPQDLQGQSTENITNYVLATSVTTANTVRLYQNLTEIMSSTVSRIKKGEDDTTPLNQRDFGVEMIPLVGIDYFADQANNQYVYELLGSYIQILRDAIPKLENSTKVDLKFYNTRGPSKYFYLDTDIRNDNAEKISLNRTDILLDFTIHVYRDVQINDASDADIKKFIAGFVEACNDEGLLPISNLMRLLEQKFNIIRYIEYNGVTGRSADSAITNTRYQKVMRDNIDLRRMTKEEVIAYVPEYINVKKQLVDHSVEVIDPNNNGKKIEKSIGSQYSDIVSITYQADY